MNSYTAISPDNQVVTINSKRDYSHAIFSVIDYGTSRPVIKHSGNASSKALAEKVAASLVARCVKNGYQVKTWVVELEQVA